MHSNLKIGFIGAGMVGQSLSQYLYRHQYAISGFLNSAHGQPEVASQAVKAKTFLNYQQLARASDWIFLTVPDDEIPNLAQQISPYLTQHQVLLHCSGIQSSTVLYQTTSPAYDYCSLHPAAIFSDNQTELAKTLFTIEGPAATVHQIKTALSRLPNLIQTINPQQKAKYHAACVFSSNFINSLMLNSQKLLQEVGANNQFANQLILSLTQQQLERIQKQGVKKALTGPIRRGDFTTIKNHLTALDPQTARLYQLLSLTLLHTCAADLSLRKKELITQELFNEKYSKDFPRI